MCVHDSLESSQWSSSVSTTQRTRQGPVGVCRAALWWPSYRALWGLQRRAVRAHLLHSALSRPTAAVQCLQPALGRASVHHLEDQVPTAGSDSACLFSGGSSRLHFWEAIWSMELPVAVTVGQYMVNHWKIYFKYKCYLTHFEANILFT